ncbi:hypothetical protein AAFX24_27605 [Vibrio mediterranei]|uniref:hypothetical protein n=1 Tax=Vibrio mediterranei TaxID=689 RepID=UPI0038CF00B3
MAKLNLELYRVESGRLYVTDQNCEKYVLIDGGEGMTRWGIARYTLFNHCKNGEPHSPVNPNLSWEYVGPNIDSFEHGLSSHHVA